LRLRVSAQFEGTTGGFFDGVLEFALLPANLFRFGDTVNFAATGPTDISKKLKVGYLATAARRATTRQISVKCYR
jgi:hypothetical protein